MNLCQIARAVLGKPSLFVADLSLIRCRHTKHWNPKWKKDRREKVIKVDLSDFEEKHDDNSEIAKERKRQKMKEKGIYPQKPWQEKPLYLSCTGSIFEAYIPPEGDGKFSAVSTTGAKQSMQFIQKKTTSYRAVKKIKNYEEEFNVHDFADQVNDIYRNAHEALANKEKDKLTDYVTEKLYPEIFYQLENKIIKWRFIGSLEPTRVVHARCTNLVTNDNIFAQVTARLHTQQTLAIYDRFGRLMSGSEILIKDVLEYVVLEKHLSNQYGRWRLHAKIIPPWAPSRPAIPKTFVMSNEL
ncbi:hypothetical protein TSAR_010450 [Trichomalopsis sarcophagae]|uniref:Large ribosomal subunit protein mL45 n=1 Tax=Trichomalopsis sarcophagae TaxID=543379 RepID=A0A232ENT9_9HYME|nr:hypothetical protein TSAR_010450 [Trichomalopsis sarcophagae]